MSSRLDRPSHSGARTATPATLTLRDAYRLRPTDWPRPLLQLDADEAWPPLAADGRDGVMRGWTRTLAPTAPTTIAPRH